MNQYGYWRNMKAIDLLKRSVVGVDAATGKPVLSRRDWLGFLLYALAGGRTVVMNAEISDGLIVTTAGARIFNSRFIGRGGS